MDVPPTRARFHRDVVGIEFLGRGEEKWLAFPDSPHRDGCQGIVFALIDIEERNQIWLVDNLWLSTWFLQQRQKLVFSAVVVVDTAKRKKKLLSRLDFYGILHVNTEQPTDDDVRQAEEEIKKGSDS